MKLLPPFHGNHRDPDILLERIGEWASSAALSRLVECFGGKIPDNDTGGRLEWLDAFSGDHWDFRRGGERCGLRIADTHVDNKLLTWAAEELGLRGCAFPVLDSFSHCLVLGGFAHSTFARALAAKSFTDEGMDLGCITGLASFRTLFPKEKRELKQFGMTAQTEIDLMEQALAVAFSTGQPWQRLGGPNSTTPRTAWEVRLHNGPRVIAAVAAPANSQAARPTTADTYRWWAENLATLKQHDRLLLVSTQIYVPYQLAEAIRTLGLHTGCELEAVGFDCLKLTEGTPAEMQPEYGPAEYLQEIRSAIRGFRGLWSAMSG